MNTDNTTITVTINNHTYKTVKLGYEDFKKLGYLSEEKLYPFVTCLFACICNNLSDSELLKALYTSCKDIFKREDLDFITELVLNRDFMTIDGKKPDNAEWELHWQKVGFCDLRVLVFNLVKENLGNFTSLSALLPNEWTQQISEQIKEKSLILLANLNAQLQKSK